MLMLPLHIFCMLCSSLVQARDSGKCILFNRFYETEQLPACAHTRQDGPHPPPPPSFPPPPQLFIFSLNIFPPAHSLCLHLSTFVKTAHLPLPLCLLSIHIEVNSGCPPALRVLVLRWSFFFGFLSFFSANLFVCFSGSEKCEEEPDPASRFWDELSHVGLPQDLNVQSLFESGRINRVNIYFTTHC